MPGLLNDVDPDGLLEYSVVFTDRSLNHMSAAFQEVMRDISATLKEVYGAHSVAVVPGGGTFAMEAVARQFANDQDCLILRNGWFSYRWSQIFAAGGMAKSETVLMATRTGPEANAPFAPADIDTVVTTIREKRPGVVFAPHVETSAGMILPDDYIAAVADAVHEVGGLFVLDGIASGTVWVDMAELGVDVFISAPQKGWSATPCAGLVMMGKSARERLDATTSSSFAGDLRKWQEIMDAYDNGGHAYHATMPTDGLKQFRDTMIETGALGWPQLKAAQQELGERVRGALAKRGIRSVAAEGFQAPGVVVCYTDDPAIQNGSKFAAEGMQIAAGVPLQCNEGPDYRSFRLGLFGLDKLTDIDRTVATLERVLDKLD